MKYIRYLLCLLLTALLAGCGNGGDGPSAPSVGTTLERIDIMPAAVTTRGVTTLTVVAGNRQGFEARGYYADGTTKNLTAFVRWTSSATAVASVEGAGTLLALTEGDTTLQATLAQSTPGGAPRVVTSNVLTVTVTAPTLLSLQVTPATVALAVGETQPLSASATYSDGTTVDVSDAVSWSSDAREVASVQAVDRIGVMTGRSEGSAAITATLAGLTSNPVSVFVSAGRAGPALTALVVSPASVTVAVDAQTPPLQALARYSDNTERDVTAAVTWSSAEDGTALVAGNGVVTGVREGTTQLQATLAGITSNGVLVTVTPASTPLPTLTAIEVTPATLSLTTQTSLPLESLVTATARYSNGNSANITALANWQVVDRGTASVSNGTLVGGVPGTTQLTASFGGLTSAPVTLTVTDGGRTLPSLVSIQVTPPAVSLPRGLSIPLTSLAATAFYSDGTSNDVSAFVSWSIVDAAIALLTNDGQIQPVATGNTTATASLPGTQGQLVVSNPVSITVTDAVVTAIQVTPPQLSTALGAQANEPLVATVYFSDNSSLLSTQSPGLVSWVVDDTATAVVSALGEMTGTAVGTTTVVARVGDVVSPPATLTVTAATVKAIEVTPSPVSVAKGQTQPLTVSAIYTDNTRLTVPAPAIAWSVVDPTLISLTPSPAQPGAVSGTDLTGLLEGSTTLTASYSDISSPPITVTVTAATLTGLQLTPSPLSLAKGQVVPLVLTATYSDNTTVNSSTTQGVDALSQLLPLTWQSQDPLIATVSDVGEVTGVAVGNTTLTVSKGNITSSPVSVTVTPALLTALQVATATPSLPLGTTQSLSLLAVYSDGSTYTDSDASPLLLPGRTWASADTAVVTVSPTGVVTAVGLGSTTVTVTANDANGQPVVSNSVSFTVTPASITALTVSAEVTSLPKGAQTPLVAMATFSDGTSSNVSNRVSWVQDDVNVVTIAPDGLLSGVVPGSTSVRATFVSPDQPSVTSNVISLTVTPAVVTQVSLVSSPDQTLAKGLSRRLTVVATYSDGTQMDSDSVPTLFSWQSLNTAVATVLDGNVQGVSAGATTVTATAGGVTSAPFNVTVTPAIVVSVALTTQANVVALRQRLFMTASATYSDGTTGVVSTLYNGASPTVAADPLVANHVPITTGSSIIVFAAVGVGTTSVTVTKDGVTSNPVSVTVNPFVRVAGVGDFYVPDDVARTQPDSAAFCANLTVGGSTWRLPSVAEYQSLYNAYPNTVFSTLRWIPSTINNPPTLGGFWTSTPSSSSGFFRFAYMGTNGVGNFSATPTTLIRTSCIRGL